MKPSAQLVESTPHSHVDTIPDITHLAIDPSKVNERAFYIWKQYGNPDSVGLHEVVDLKECELLSCRKRTANGNETGRNLSSSMTSREEGAPFVDSSPSATSSEWNGRSCTCEKRSTTLTRRMIPSSTCLSFSDSRWTNSTDLISSWFGKRWLHSTSAAFQLCCRGVYRVHWIRRSHTGRASELFRFDAFL